MITLVSRVAPPPIASADFEDDGRAIAMHPTEAVHVAGSAEKRRRDFALGRACARIALAHLGVDAILPKGEGGAPVWPRDIVGSITHTTGYAAALVAWRRDFQAIGIDAERIGRISPRMAGMLFGPAERAWLDALGEAERNRAATIFFSAKEAYYKAWHPVAGTPLGFHALHVRLEGDGFVASRPDAMDGWAGVVTGRYAVEGNLVVTAICVPAG